MKRPYIIHTDLDLKFNKLEHVTIDDPINDNDPSNKKYVDNEVILNTEHSKKFIRPFISVGGITINDEVHLQKLIPLIDKMFFPRLLPEYKEGEFIIQNEPINVFIGVKIKHQCKIDIDLGDRKNVIGNISCILKNALGVTTTTYVNPGSELKNIICNFDAKEIDPQFISELSLSVLLSNANVKNDSYGEPYIPSIFANNYTITKIIKYRGILPLFYKIINSTEESPIDVTLEDITWNNITSNLEFISNDALYIDNVGTREVSIKIPNDNAKKVILFVPNIPKGIYINNFDILDCLNTKQHKMILPNSRDGVTQLYTGVEFFTGDVPFNKESTLRIVWENVNYVRMVNTPIELNEPSKTEINGHIIIDDNGIEHQYNKRLHITNATVDDIPENETTRINVHPKNADVDGGYYDE